MGYSDEREKDLEVRFDEVEEVLENIPEGKKNPRIEHMKIHSAKSYRLGIVFVDIHRFSGYLAKNGRKDTATMLNVLIPEILEDVFVMDGYFEKNTGDGILAYFGAGDDDEKAALRVLVFYLLNWLTMSRVNEALKGRGYDPVLVNVAAAYGDTWVSRIGRASTKEQQFNTLTAISSAANFAARLEEEADNGVYLIGSELKSLAEQNDALNGVFEFVDVGELDFLTDSSTTPESRRCYVVAAGDELEGLTRIVWRCTGVGLRTEY